MKSFNDIINESVKKKLKIDTKASNEIKRIYSDTYKELNKKLKKVNPSTLEYRFIEEMQKELSEMLRENRKLTTKTIKKAIEDSAKAATDEQISFFNELDKAYTLEMGKTFRDMFVTIHEDVVKEIVAGDLYKDRKGLSKRLWKYDKSYNKDIDQIIAEGVAAKKSNYQIAKDLLAYTKNFGNRSYNARRLARTAIQHSYQLAQIRSCKKNPYIEKLKWLSGNGTKTCELCASRDGNIYLLDQVPFDHPNGRCTTIPILEKSFDDIGEELSNWINEKDNPVLDKWFNKFGKEFI